MFRTMRVIAMVWFLSAACGLQASEKGFSLWPLGGHESFADGAVHTEALADVFGYASDSRFEAVRFSPLFFWGAVGERRAADGLYPLAEWRKGNVGGHLRVFNYLQTFDPHGSGYDRFLFFPLFFYGHSRDSEPFGGIFPLGGRYCGLGYDRIDFALFPLWMRTKERDISGQSFLWPLVNYDIGKKVEHFRVWPFYGYRAKEDNLSRFVLFPFWTQSRKPSKDESAWMAWPLFGISGNKTSTSYTSFWPFFSVRTRLPDSGKVFDRGGFGFRAPWPVLSYSRGIAQAPEVPALDMDPFEPEGGVVRTEDWQLTVWPLFGRFERLHSEGGFALWPLVWDQTFRAESKRTDRLKVFPFYASKVERAYNPDEKGKCERLIFPLWRYVSSAKGEEVVFPELWPFERHAVVQRNYAPLWTLFRHVRSGENVSTRILYGLFSSERRATQSVMNWGWVWREERNEVQGVFSESLFGGLFESRGDLKESRKKLFWMFDL